MTEHLSYAEAWDEAIAVNEAHKATKYASALMTAQDRAGPSTMVMAWELAAYALRDVANLDTFSEAERLEASRLAIDAALKTNKFGLIRELGQRDLAYLDQQIEELPAQLTDREKKVLRRRFGIGVDAPQTFLQIQPELRVSKERIRSIQNTALSKIWLAALGFPVRGQL